MNKISENLITVIIGLLFLFLALKSCIRTTIPSIGNIEKYQSIQTNGEIDINYLCPGNILVYSKSNYGVIDIGVFKIQRRSIIHYGGAFYNVDTDGTPFGIRYYPGIDDAWNVNLSFKIRSGTSTQSTFSNLVEYDEVFKFSDNSKILQIGDTKYVKTPLSQEEISKITYLIKDVK
jgi:hypothetical protein